MVIASRVGAGTLGLCWRMLVEVQEGKHVSPGDGAAFAYLSHSPAKSLVGIRRSYKPGFPRLYLIHL
jgi:hypothetical protein